MVELRRPCSELFPSYMEFIEEMKANGDKVWEGMLPRPSESGDSFVKRILHEDEKPKPGFVAATTYWGVIGKLVVGRISLRHELNENLKEFGGHIGYEVRPSSRRKGVAKEMLRQILQTPKGQSIGRLLLTCDPDNIASNRTILANDGVLEKTAFLQKWNRHTNYYWIDLT